MLRRCSRQQRSQVQTCRPSSRPSAQVRRASDSSSEIRPHVAHTGRAVFSLIRPVSTAHPTPDGIFGTMATRLIEPSTSRLVLRQWREDDREPFAALNADPLVMEHFPTSLERHQSDAMMNRCVEELQRDGYGLWAVEVRTSGEFIGFVGLAAPICGCGVHPCT